MGVPSSPSFLRSSGNGPAATSASRRASPELPLLQAASELLSQTQGLDLLPASAVFDMNGEECLEKNTLSASFTPPSTSTRLDEERSESAATSPGESAATSPGPEVPSEFDKTRSLAWRDLPPFPLELFEKNTFLEMFDDQETTNAKACEYRRRAYSEFTGLADLEAHAITEISTELLKEQWPKSEEDSWKSSLEQPFSDEKEDEGKYIALWCQVQKCEDGEFIVPCPEWPVNSEELYVDGEERSFYGDDPSVSYRALWCWQQPSAQGMMVVPCTDKGGTQDSEKAKPSQEACAQLPPPGSYVPKWTPGPYWPYNVAPTTLVLSNLPAKMTQETLLEFIDKEEFCASYDFIFMPVDLRTGLNHSYCVLNMTEHSHGLALAGKFHGRTKWGAESGERECEVSWCVNGQGLDCLIQRYRNTSENHDIVPDEFRPQLFANGWPKNFPRPSVPVAAPIIDESWM